MTTPADPVESMSAEERETIELYAFLDGQLDADSCARIEARILSDRAFAGRVQRLEHALGVSANIVRDDADRIYAHAGVDALADRVMAAIATPAPVAKVIPIGAAKPAAVAESPRSSRVIWVTFGAIAAVAAAAVFFVSRVDPGGSGDSKVAGSTSSSLRGSTTVIAKGPSSTSVTASAPSPSVPPTVVGAVQIDDLEVGEGASVIYSGDGEGTPAVVWVSDSREGAM